MVGLFSGSRVNRGGSVPCWSSRTALINITREATMHLSVLTTNVVMTRSWFGTVALDDEEIVGVVEAGVRVFLGGYGPHS